jgi:hypothetical protein
MNSYDFFLTNRVSITPDGRTARLVVFIGRHDVAKRARLSSEFFSSKISERKLASGVDVGTNWLQLLVLSYALRAARDAAFRHRSFPLLTELEQGPRLAGPAWPGGSTQRRQPGVCCVPLSRRRFVWIAVHSSMAPSRPGPP